ncbi:MAG: flagellar hook-length control protein FliK [Gammaproteobacteria bacterium]|nr:flagellar hook-length control protein FliK [Gammaproteobacteria bacterium]
MDASTNRADTPLIGRDLRILGQQSTSTAFRVTDVGRIVRAEVVTANPSGSATVRIGSATFTALAGPALAEGAILTLKVAQTEPRLVFRIVANASGDGSHLAALRAAVSRQEPLRDVFTRVANVDLTGLPTAVQRLSGQLLASIAPVAHITHAAGLQSAIQRSGRFLEADLARQLTASGLEPTARVPTDFSTDLKAILFRLTRGLNDDSDGHHTPPQSEQTLARLRADALAGLSRIVSQQHRQHVVEQGGGVYAVELPYRDLRGRIDTITFTFFKPQTSSSDARTQVLELHASPPGLGDVAARIRLHEGNVSIGLWAKRPGTAALFDTHIEALRAALVNQALKISSIHRLHAEPPPPAMHASNFIDLSA